MIPAQPRNYCECGDYCQICHPELCEPAPASRTSLTVDASVALQMAVRAARMRFIGFWIEAYKLRFPGEYGRDSEPTISRELTEYWSQQIDKLDRAAVELRALRVGDE